MIGYAIPIATAGLAERHRCALLVALNKRMIKINLIAAALLATSGSTQAQSSTGRLRVQLEGTNSVVPGEPLFVGLRIFSPRSNAGAALAFDFKSDFHAGVSTRIGSVGGVGLLSNVGRQGASPVQVARLQLQPVNAGESFTDLFLLNLDTSRLRPGTYEFLVKLNSTGGIAKGGLPEQFVSGSTFPIAATQTFTLTVGAPSREKLLATASKIGDATMFDSTGSAPAPRFSEGIGAGMMSIDTCLTALAHMPPEPCSEVWRSLLRTDAFAQKGLVVKLLVALDQANKVALEPLLAEALAASEARRDRLKQDSTTPKERLNQAEQEIWAIKGLMRK